MGFLKRLDKGWYVFAVLVLLMIGRFAYVSSQDLPPPEITPEQRKAMEERSGHQLNAFESIVVTWLEARPITEESFVVCWKAPEPMLVSVVGNEADVSEPH